MTFSVAVKHGRETLTLTVDDDATTGDVQRILEQRTGVLATMQKLLYKGRVLASAQRLSDVGIGDGGRIMLLATTGTRTNGQEVAARQAAEKRLEATKARVQKRREQQNAPPSQPTAQEQIRNWTRLKIIAARELDLTEFPLHALDVGAAAETADFSHNAIVELPCELAQIANLKSIDLAYNQLTTAGIGLGLFQLQQLRKLNLDRNHLAEVPAEIGQLVMLEKLKLSNNGLTMLPETFGALIKLTDLDLSSNALTALPSSLGNCVALRVMNIQHNCISELPESFSALIDLHMLRADQNRIRSVQPSLLKGCQSLVLLSLHQNPISLQQFRETEGFDAYEARRQGMYDKKLDTGAMQPGERFDESADQERRHT